MSAKVLITLFIIKVIAGIAYFQFHSLPSYKYRSDTWRFYNWSIKEAEHLKKDPSGFVKDLFTSSYENTGGLFSDQSSYWNDVKDAVIVKLMAVTNLFTWNSYYANIIFFNFLFFIGLMALYRLMKSLYPDKQVLLLISIFLIPSFLFWCSGIHKDGLIFSALGLLMYCFHQLLNNRFTARYIGVIIICLAAIFFLRNYFIALLLPFMFMGWLIKLYPKRIAVIIVSGLVVGIGFIFSARYIHPSLDIPSYIVEKQNQFNKLEGNTLVATGDLDPSFKGFISALPTAIDFGFFRPHPGEQGLISWITFAEIILFWMTFLCCIIFSKKKFSQPPVIWTMWLFAFCVLLIIGYTVHFSGAVVRYRSLVLSLILTPAIGASTLFKYINKKYI